MLKEVINLHSDQQEYTVLRNDAILSSSLLPEDELVEWSCACLFPMNRCPLRDPSFLHPILLPPLYFMMSLCLLKSSRLFYLRHMCRALKVKPRCLWVPNCLSILCFCFSVSVLPIKAQLPLLFWEIAVGCLCTNPRLSTSLTCRVLKKIVCMCVQVYWQNCLFCLPECCLNSVTIFPRAGVLWCIFGNTASLWSTKTSMS